MIDAIKIRTSVWYANEPIKEKINIQSESQNMNQDVNFEKNTERLQDYFYEQISREKKEASKMTSTQHVSPISPYAVDYLAQDGYDVEDLEVGSFERLQQNVSTLARSTSNSQTESKARYSGLDDKIDRLKEHTDSMYVYGVTQQGSLSINDLYKGSFSGTSSKQNTPYSNNQIGQILSMNNILHTQGNNWAASKLLELNLDVSKDSMLKIQNIKAAVDGLQKEDEAQKAAEDIEQGLAPGERPLMEEEKILYTEKDMQEIIDDLTEVDDDIIQDTLLDGKEITIGNLRETMHKNTEKALGKVAKESTGQEAPDQDVQIVEQEKTITETKEHIKEIRARLSASAAIKISEKMPLESTELSKVVKELIALEEVQIDQAIDEVQLQPTQANKQLIKDTMKATYIMNNHKEWSVGLEMLQEGNLAIEDFGKVLTVYEGNFLQAEKRFGETLAKVENQIEEFLIQEQIPATTENIQAAKALISNQLDLSQENIKEAAQVMTKINTFLEEMTPERAAILIKEGVNPYKASVNQLLEWVATEKLPALKGTVAEAIVSLEDSGSINEAQKKSLIGLYRMIGAVTSHKEEIAGYLYKNKLPLTIDKLEEASKYIGKTEHIKVAIDDQFGELEQVKYSRETAKQMIETGKLENSKLTTLMELLEHTDLEVNFKEGDKLSEITARIYPFIKEQIKKELGKFEGISSLSPSMMEKLEGIKQINPEVIEVMQQYKIPVTVANLYWMNKLIQEPNLYTQIMEEQGLAKDVLPEDLEDLEKQLEELGIQAKAQKESSVEKGDILGYRAYKKLEEVVGLQKQLIEKEGIYQIPFVVGGETKLINLRVQNNAKSTLQEEGGLKAIITYETKTLGTVVAKLEISKEKISYEVQGQSAEATSKLRQNNKALEDTLQMLGYMITQNDYVIGGGHHPLQAVTTQAKTGDSSFEEVV